MGAGGCGPGTLTAGDATDLTRTGDGTLDVAGDAVDREAVGDGTLVAAGEMAFLVAAAALPKPLIPAMPAALLGMGTGLVVC